MLTRLVIILSLLWQPFAASAVVVRPDERPEVSDTMPCCEVVTRTTCCGETVVERICPMEASGICSCGVRSSDEPAPTRERPVTGVERERVQMARPGPRRPVVVAEHAAKPRLCGGPVAFSAMHANRSHNVVRALLSNWRT